VIFVTVGAQMPFDRLVLGVDRWAQSRGRRNVFAQIGLEGRRPGFIQFKAFLNPDEFRTHVESASVVVAHAGMGSILTALELGKPILVMPRRGDLFETRNDHQVATARRLAEQGRVSVAWDDTQLDAALDRIDQLQPARRIGTQASPQLLEAIRSFIFNRDVAPVGHREYAVGNRQ
jgi:UDP-N-acetylglucosamine transferase subunit ALG13